MTLKKILNSIKQLNNRTNSLENNITGVNSHCGIVKIGNTRIEYGRIGDVEVPASSYKQYIVNFSKSFGQVPNVFAQSVGNYNIKTDVSGSEVGKATFNVRSMDGTARTGRSIDWMAIGPDE